MWVGSLIVVTIIVLVNKVHRHRSWANFATFEVFGLILATMFVVAMYGILRLSLGSPPLAGLRRRR